jgi:hypothetical protein
LNTSMRVRIGSPFAIVLFRLPPRCSCPGQQSVRMDDDNPFPLPAPTHDTACCSKNFIRWSQQ